MPSGYQSKSQAKRYLKELAGAYDRDFQHACHNLLKQLWPEIRYAKDLRHFDRAGVDLFLSTHYGTIDVAIQCKGFETLNFGQKHLKQCVKSIDAFKKSNFNCEEYFLLINQPFIKDAEVRKSLEAELKELERLHKVKKAKLLDLQRFLNFFFAKLEEVLLEGIQLRNRKYLTQYDETIGTGIYIQDVPFKKNLATAEINPLLYLSEDISRRLQSRSKQPLQQLQKFWTIIVSEFGFGKTSLLLQLSKQLKEVGLEALYVPIALIPPNGFDGETNFVRCLLQMIYEENDELDVYRSSIWDVPLRHILQSRHDFVLLLDGIDEHRYAYTTDGIKQILGGLRHLTRHVVLSVRKEFWEDRAGNINMAIGNADRNRQVITLEEWNDDAIINFLIEKKKSTKSEALLDLISMIRTERYDTLYGDIPKRPLFLEMLAQDVMSGEVRKRTIAELYEKYFFQKIERDTTSPFSTNKSPGRPLGSMGFDLYDLERRLLLMLENIAGRTAIEAAETGQVQLLEKFPEDWVSEAAKLVNLPSQSVVPYLTGTILVPTTARSREKSSLDIRFAHRSFQEYFLARQLCHDLEQSTNSAQILSNYQRLFSNGVLMFVKSILASADSFNRTSP